MMIYDHEELILIIFKQFSAPFCIVLSNLIVVHCVLFTYHHSSLFRTTVETKPNVVLIFDT